ncbi:MAG TPA: PepSY-associated TM helix domain-containing protein [Archangium sp.]|uniref:PepSY-associated TM helix domain-containing protein n=1 Tax=Archangium sp. TaxID=1872627 RepID=UPI002E3222EE|nr:PepSY-associated TM helix domain-containing protein [Archangium sp.]HEX5746329.1 PepSY-associated TM helix domain-containing protein [Archangium sp.]
MRLRRFLFQVHLYAGLLVGALLAVTGLTGSALVFGEELDRQLQPEVWGVVPGGERVPVSRVLESVAASQAGASPLYLRMPQRPDAPVVAWMDAHGSRRVYVDPYSGAVLGVRSTGDSLVATLRELHVSLLSGGAGEAVVGASGCVLIVLGLSGLVLWWPGRRKLALGFTLRRPLLWRRANYDLHKLGGIFSLVFLLLSALTGVSLVFPAPFEQTLRWATRAPARSAPPVPGPATGAPLPIDVLLAAAERALPGARITRVDLPASPTAPLRVRERLPEEPHPLGMSLVYVDRHTGAVLRADNALEAPLASRLLALRYPLHIGAWGGLATRCLAVLTGLFPAGLFLTGFFLWLSGRNPRR